MMIHVVDACLCFWLAIMTFCVPLVAFIITREKLTLLLYLIFLPIGIDGVATGIAILGMIRPPLWY